MQKYVKVNKAVKIIQKMQIIAKKKRKKCLQRAKVYQQV